MKLFLARPSACRVHSVHHARVTKDVGFTGVSGTLHGFVLVHGVHPTGRRSPDFPAGFVSQTGPGMKLFLARPSACRVHSVHHARVTKDVGFTGVSGTLHGFVLVHGVHPTGRRSPDFPAGFVSQTGPGMKLFLARPSACRVHSVHHARVTKDVGFTGVSGTLHGFVLVHGVHPTGRRSPDFPAGFVSQTAPGMKLFLARPSACRVHSVHHARVSKGFGVTDVLGTW